MAHAARRPATLPVVSRRREIAQRRVGALAVLGALASFAMLLPSAASAAPRTVWLCKPGIKANPCASSLKTTVRGPSGPDKIYNARPLRRPKIDCFYVYPTVSSQTTDNATLAKDPEILEIARQQASRFSQACRVFAPVYRQATIAGLTRPTSGTAFKIAYGDVKRAWFDYLRHYNHGRGFVLIGHSQGGGHLAQLLKEEIDPRPARRRQLVSALLLGANVTVPVGKTVGAEFKHVPACTARRQFRCIVAYSAFDTTPPDDALFGRIGGAFTSGNPNKVEVLCTDPSRLAGDRGAMRTFIRTTPFPGALGFVTPTPPDASTPWVSLPQLYRSHCAHADGADWLQVTDIAKPGDDRPRFTATLGASWGLHLGDVNLELGSLIKLVRIQTRGYLLESVAE